MRKRRRDLLSPRDYLHAKTKHDPITGCWNWTGCIQANGYTFFVNKQFSNKTWLGHRASWVIYNGPISDNLCVLHKCDNRRCVNPEHLFLGTYQDNRDDCIKKKRHCFGTKWKNAKLNDKSVIEMRELRTKGFSCGELAKMYKINEKLAWNVVNYRRWQHVE